MLIVIVEWQSQVNVSLYETLQILSVPRLK